MTVVGQQLINTVRALAADNPGFVYNSPFVEDGACVYVHEGEPSCIVGRALWSNGFINSDFEQTEQNDWSVGDLLDYLGLKLDPDERKWLRDVQNGQDNRETWSEAVVLADKYALKRLLKAGIG